MTLHSKLPQRLQSRAAIVIPALAVALALSGCAGFVTTASPTAAAGIAISGTIHGGQQAISGAQVYLYSAGTSGYGSASTSLLLTSKPGVSTDSNSNGYVTSDAYGGFTITGDYAACSSGTAQTYLLATGGNPGLSGQVNNTAISLIAAIGNCSSLGSGLVVSVNELSTVAAVTALQQFMVDPTHIGATSTNLAGISNAFTSVTNIVALGTGAANSTNALGNGSVPTAKINTLGDILAPCINSSSPTSSACTGLFTNAMPSGGATLSDVASAMLDIAQNPSTNTGNLYGQMDAKAPFQPALSSTPNDFTIGITYTGGGLQNPGSIAIDANGAAWVTNCPECSSASGTDSIVAFGPQGAVLTGSGGYTNSINAPQGIAIDASGYVWVTDVNNGTLPDEIVRMNAAGTISSGFPYTDAGSLSTPVGVALDSTGGNAFITNESNNTVIKLTSAGVLSGTVSSSGFVAPAGIGVDGAGNVFAAGAGSASVLKFSGSSLAVLSGSGAGYTGGGLTEPLGLAIDGSDNIWTINQSYVVSIINGVAGAAVAPSGGYYESLNQAAIVSIDGLGTAWIANCNAECGSSGPDYVIHMNSAGTNISGVLGYQDTNFSTIGATAIDRSGNVWVSNNSGGSLTELLGVAGPVATPLNPATLGVRP